MWTPPQDLPEALNAAMREADTAFGDPTVFLEQAVLRPRHIEVQILADGEGNVIHLFERDCSLQRRHQKVIEIAPAPNLDENIRQALYRDAVKFAKALNYVNAGTVEFLVDTVGERAGQHVFIEMNPRIQVEHTVTEEITDVDLVQSQMRIAAGENPGGPGAASRTNCRSAARPCSAGSPPKTRPTASAPTSERSAPTAPPAAQASGWTAAPSTPAPTSARTSTPCWSSSPAAAATYPAAVNRARRALAEFRIRGVSTNISFLQAVLDDPDFVAGDVATSFIEERPELLNARGSADRGTKLLNWLADVTVNKPNGELPAHIDPAEKLPTDLPEVRARIPPAAPGTRARRSFAAELRAQQALAVTDTTFRDAHQSLLATRVRDPRPAWALLRRLLP